jgi:transcription initiation factor IIE alpha subunit
VNTDVTKESQATAFQTTNRYIRCPDCGEEIMLVPILSQMIEAIENHISTHKVNQKQPRIDFALPYPKPPEIRDSLTEQVLQRAAEISDALSKNETWINPK